MLIYFAILGAIMLRFIPHMPNFAPITALAIFSAANLSWKKSVGITLAARFFSDLFLGFFSWPLMLAVYTSHLVGILFGLWIRGKTTDVIPDSDPESRLWILKQVQDDATKKWLKVFISSLGASFIFFLVTNFAFLYTGYAHNFSGIILSYTNALPFLRGTLAGDLGYTVALFGGVKVFSLFLQYRRILKLVHA
jgi:hypothetical protein